MHGWGHVVPFFMQSEVVVQMQMCVWDVPFDFFGCGVCGCVRYFGGRRRNGGIDAGFLLRRFLEECGENFWRVGVWLKR